MELFSIKIRCTFQLVSTPLCIYDYQFPANEDEFQDILIIRNRLMEYMSDILSE